VTLDAVDSTTIVLLPKRATRETIDALSSFEGRQPWHDRRLSEQPSELGEKHSV
jgi:hypothetical protein